MLRAVSVWLAICATSSIIYAATPKSAQVSSLKPSDIQEFDSQPEVIQDLIRYSLDLTKKKLAYRYGGSDPSAGGMDCSGTVYHILQEQGLKPPRQSNTLYLWVEAAGNLRKVKGAHKTSNPQLSKLKPGDLLFWEGTYNVGKRTPPTSHVMIYVGHRKSDGKPIMVGASSGRYYDGKARHGVSVFDFNLPRVGSKSSFVGYGPIPGFEHAVAQKAAPQPDPEPDPEPATVTVAAQKESASSSGGNPAGSTAVVERSVTASASGTSASPSAKRPGAKLLDRLKGVENELAELKAKLEARSRNQ